MVVEEALQGAVLLAEALRLVLGRLPIALAELLVEREVRLVDTGLHVAAARGAVVPLLLGLLDQVALLAVGHDQGDVLRLEQEVHHALGDRLVGRVEARGRIVFLPVAREVAVDHRVPLGVLGHLFVSVAVQALGQELPGAALALGAVGLAQGPRVVRVGEPGALGVRHAHPAHDPVAVHVRGAVLPLAPVAVVVEAVARAEHLGQGRREARLAAVHVEARDHVDRRRVEQPGHLLVPPVARHQLPGVAQGQARGVGPRTVDAGHDQDRRGPGHWVRAVGDTQGGDLAPGAGGGDGQLPDLVAVLQDQALDTLLEGGVVEQRGAGLGRCGAAERGPEGQYAQQLEAGGDHGHSSSDRLRAEECSGPGGGPRPLT